MSMSTRTIEAPIVASSLNDSKAIDHGRIGMDGPASSVHTHGLAPISEPSKQSKPVLPAIVPGFVAPQMMTTLPTSAVSPSSGKALSGTQSPKSARARESPAAILNVPLFDLSNSAQNSSRPPAGSFPLPPPMLTRLPRRPTTADGHFPSSSQSSSIEDIRAGYRSRTNSNTPNLLSQPVAPLKIAQPSNPLSQRSQRPTAQAISHPSTTDFAIGEQRSTFASENGAFTTQPLLEGRSVTSSDVGARDGAVNNDHKPSHWPKQASNVHWITAEETADTDVTWQP